MNIPLAPLPSPLRRVTGWPLRLAMRRRRLLAGTLAAALAVQGLLALVVPWLMSGPVLSTARDALGRQVALERASFNPFTWTLTLDGVRIQEKAPLSDRNFMTVRRLTMDVSAESIVRLAPVLDAVRIDAPRVALVHTGPDGLNISDLIAPRTGPVRPPPRFALNNFAVHDGELLLEDVPRGIRHTVDRIELSLPRLDSLGREPGVTDLVTPLLTARFHGGSLRLDARARPFATDADTTLQLRLQGLDLAAALSRLPPGTLSSWRAEGGRLDTDVDLTLHHTDPAAASDGTVISAKAQVNARGLSLVTPQGERIAGAGLHLGIDRVRLQLDPAGLQMKIDGGRLEVSELRLADSTDQPALVALKSLRLEQVALDARERLVRIGQAHVAGLAVHGRRDRLGRLDTTRWLERFRGPATTTTSAGRAPSPAAQAVPSLPAGREAAAWSLDLARASVSNASVSWRDEAALPPVELGLRGIEAEFQGLSTRPGAPAQVKLQAAMAHGGTVALDGSVQPVGALQAQAQLQLRSLNLAVIGPYLADALNLELSSGLLSAHGRLTVNDHAGTGLRLGYQGEADIANLHTREPGTRDDLLRWKKLSTTGLNVDISPKALSNRDRVDIGLLTLQDVDARVEIDPQGRFNLQDVLRTPGQQAASAPPPALPSPPDVALAPDVPAAAPPAEGPKVHLGGLRIEGGRLRFSDRFIRPNYSAHVTDLKGSLSAVGPDSPPAGLLLRGRVDGHAPVDIEGRINPVAKTLSADIGAKVRGIDLPMMSPYSSKYVGYAIERGKLSLDLRYRIEDGKLTADNRIFLDQLTLGTPVESPTATRLPVLFAVALLKNSRGEIDLHLPVDGSLDDPSFSIGGVVRQAALNLLKRVVASPFAALSALVPGPAGSAGNTDDMGMADFEPGTDTLTSASKARLEKLAKALADRPALRLDITGHIDPVAELGPLRRATLAARLQEARDAEREARGGSVASSSSTASAEDLARWLQQVYDHTPLPDKPRTLTGAARKLSGDEMESRLMSATVVTDTDLLDLARSRASVALRALAEAGVATERMFLRSPVVSPAPQAAVGAAAEPAVCWSACVRFDLR